MYMSYIYIYVWYLVFGIELVPPCSATTTIIAAGHVLYNPLWVVNERAFLWALVVGTFDSGGVCSMGPCFVYAM